MKKYLLIFILLVLFKNSYSQCVTTYGTIYYTSCIMNGGYYFDGNLLEGSGTYTETLTNYQGCDSIVTLYLTMYQENTGTANISICENQLPYVWNGQLIYYGGFNEVELPPACPACCDSLVDLNVTVLPVPTSTTNKTICSTQLPYNWNGQVITESGDYSANIVTSNPNDCDSIAQLNLTVINNPSGTTNATICANKLPYVWNGQNYTATGTYTMNFSNNPCDSIATLNLTVKPVATLTSFSPTTASRGESIVITGTNLLDASNVTIGGTPAQYFTVESPTTLVATVGTAASGTISVTTGCTVDSLAGFSYNSMPGNMGIGTQNPTSKFTISGGDLQLTDIGAGIILKSPDGTCWKLYMSNTEGGINGLHIVKVPCP